MKRSLVLRICSGSAFAFRPCAQALRFHAWASLFSNKEAENTSTRSITGRLAMQPASVPWRVQPCLPPGLSALT